MKPTPVTPVRVFKCAKCESETVTVRFFKTEELGEMLSCKCSRCSYFWHEDVSQPLKATLGQIADGNAR